MALTMCNVLNPSVDEQIAVFGLQQGLSHEVFIHFSGAFPSFTDGHTTNDFPLQISRQKNEGYIGLELMPDDVFLAFNCGVAHGE